MSRYNTFWPRFMALMIDGFLLKIVIGVISLIFSKDSIIYIYININIAYIYSILMLAIYGQTIGKMAMKIAVVDNETEGKITLYQSIMREIIPLTIVNSVFIINIIVFSDIDATEYEFSTLGYIFLILPSSMLIIWSILEIITMLFDKKHRALHDKVANTVVIKV